MKQAFEEGIRLGIKYGTALLLVAIMAGSAGLWLVEDYRLVRKQSELGAAAFQYLDKQVRAQQAKQEAARKMVKPAAEPPADGN